MKKRQHSLLDMMIAEDRRRAAPKQKQEKAFIAECQSAKKIGGLTIDDAILVLSEVKRLAAGDDVHKKLVDLIEVVNGRENETDESEESN